MTARDRLAGAARNQCDRNIGAPQRTPESGPDHSAPANENDDMNVPR
jgi:hypothetical protein